MKLLDIQENSKSNRNEVVFSKYPATRIHHHTNEFAHRQQYGRWNWRNDQSQHPDTIYNRFKLQCIISSVYITFYNRLSFSLQRPTMYPRNQRLPQRPEVLRPDTPTF
ncbi:hypothetical protein TNCV_1081861 [Trichonephila clavipes]|nr:hypothetical protein TNCV_1081861 [Trichonephila clavipes]